MDILSVLVVGLIGLLVAVLAHIVN